MSQRACVIVWLGLYVLSDFGAWTHQDTGLTSKGMLHLCTEHCHVHAMCRDALPPSRAATQHLWRHGCVLHRWAVLADGPGPASMAGCIAGGLYLDHGDAAVSHAPPYDPPVHNFTIDLHFSPWQSSVGGCLL